MDSRKAEFGHKNAAAKQLPILAASCGCHISESHLKAARRWGKARGDTPDIQFVGKLLNLIMNPCSFPRPLPADALPRTITHRRGFVKPKYRKTKGKPRKTKGSTRKTNGKPRKTKSKPRKTKGSTRKTRGCRPLPRQSKNPRVSPGAFEKRREEMKSTAACRFALHPYHSGQL